VFAKALSRRPTYSPALYQIKSAIAKRFVQNPGIIIIIIVFSFLIIKLDRMQNDTISMKG